MRSYEAAKREATGAPVQFEIAYADAAGRRQAEIFSCFGQISSVTLSEFARYSDLAVATPEALLLLSQFFEEAFDDAGEYRRFLRFRSEHRLSDEQISDIVGGLIEDFSARPTVQPARSQAGPSPSGPTSRGDSALQVVPGQVAPMPFTVVEGVDELQAFSA